MSLTLNFFLINNHMKDFCLMFLSFSTEMGYGEALSLVFVGFCFQKGRNKHTHKAKEII